MLVQVQFDEDDALALQEAAARQHMSPEHFVSLAVHDTLAQLAHAEMQAKRVQQLLTDWQQRASDLPSLPESSFKREFAYED